MPASLFAGVPNCRRCRHPQPRSGCAVPPRPQRRQMFDHEQSRMTIPPPWRRAIMRWAIQSKMCCSARGQWMIPSSRRCVHSGDFRNLHRRRRRSSPSAAVTITILSHPATHDGGRRFGIPYFVFAWLAFQMRRGANCWAGVHRERVSVASSRKILPALPRSPAPGDFLMRVFRPLQERSANRGAGPAMGCRTGSLWTWWRSGGEAGGRGCCPGGRSAVRMMPPWSMRRRRVRRSAVSATEARQPRDTAPAAG